MLEHAKLFVLTNDISFYLFIFWSIYLYIYQDGDIIDKTLSKDRTDPNFMTEKDLISLLDSRGEVFSIKADKRRLVKLAKTKVVVEESEPPVSADLSSLSVRELKHLLDERGIMHYSRSTIDDLITTVNISGPVTQEAVVHMNKKGAPVLEKLHEFNAFNFDKTLETYNDSIFLINILPPRRKFSYFNESSWTSLRKKLSYMEFKFGELDCDFEKSICLRMKWNMSTLYLYIPGKDIDNLQITIREDYSLHTIFKHIQQSVSAKITHLTTWDEFASSKFAFYYGPNDKVPVRIVLFTNMTKPPLFLSALSIKHRHKVNFGMVNMASSKGRTILRKLKQKYWPLCLVVTKHAILTYGKIHGEYFTYRDLNMFIESLLRDFQPVRQWYNKFSFLLDLKLIGILIIRFIARNILQNLPSTLRPKRTQQKHENYRPEQGKEDGENEQNKNNDFTTYFVHDGKNRLKIKIDKATVTQFARELLRQRTNHSTS